MFMPRATIFPIPTALLYIQGLALPFAVQLTIALISFLWVRSLERTLRERDRAQEIARLQHDLAIQSERLVRQKEQLERSIDLINQVQVRVASGDLNARVPLSQENVLWRVAGTLNNLIARLQRQSLIGQELEQTKADSLLLTKILQARKNNQVGPQYIRRGTVIDPIAMELLPLNQLQSSTPAQTRKAKAIVR